MNLLNVIPTVGANASGLPTMLVMDSTKAVTSSSVEVLNSGGSGDVWINSTIESMQQTPNGLLATGYSTTKSGARVNAAWKYSSSWTSGLVSFSGVRDDSGISYAGSNFLVAADSNVKFSPFNFTSGSPVGNVSSTITATPNSSASNFAVDNISSNGSIQVATSMSSTGVRKPNGSIVENGTWDFYAGEPIPVDTGHILTTYTFPGYSGGNAQIQRTMAVHNGDTPPTQWDTVNNNNEGYYGLSNCPSFTFEWVA